MDKPLTFWTLSIFLLFFLGSGVSTATDSLSIFPVYPSKITAYDIEQGLPASCVSGAFVDKAGRLWLNPCSKENIQRTQSFFQYDSYRSYFPKIKVPGKEREFGQALIHGVLYSGELFGKVQSLGNVFIFDTDTYTTVFFTISKDESLINVIADENDILYILSHDSEARFIYKIENRQLSKIGRIPYASPDLRNYNTEQHFKLFLKTGKDLWFLGDTPLGKYEVSENLSDYGLIRFDMEEASFERFSFLKILEGAEILPGSLVIKFANLSLDGLGNIIIPLSNPDQIAFFDPVTESSTTNHPLNSILKGINAESYEVTVHPDKQHNLLFKISARFKDGKVNRSYILMDSRREFFDYGPVIESVAKASRYGGGEVHEILSNDFKKEAYLSLAGGLVVADIQPLLPVQIILKGNSLRSITELAPNRLWVMTESDNLQIVDTETGSTLPVSLNDLCHERKEILPSSFVSIKKDSRGNIFLPIRDQLVKYNPDSNVCITYPIGIEFEKFDFVSDELIVLVSLKNQVYFYDIKKERLQAFEEDGEPLNIKGYANDIIISIDGIIWIASLDGLWKIDRKTGKSRRYGKTDGFKDERLICILEDEKGRLWIGSYSHGLHIFDPDKGVINIIGKNKGLSSNTVVGILTDEDGDHWVSTYYGITILSSLGVVLSHIYQEDGLSDKESNRFSFYKKSDGKLIFGMVNGGNIIDPKMIKDKLFQKKELNIYLTWLRYFDEKDNKEIERTNGFVRMNRINLPAGKRYLKVNFALSNYNDPESSQFSYKITNKSNDVDWIDIGSISSLTLNNLPVGQYDILVRGINYNGQITEQPIIIPVRVKEFFYRKWWFYLICSLPFGLFAFLWYRRNKSEKSRLEEEVKKRTEKIVAQTEVLKQLDEMKSRFFTNISHELRTPLTIISGMAEKMKESPEKWLSKGYLMIKRNSANLLNLVAQILDLRKLESGKLKLDLTQSDIIHYLNYLVESFHSLADSKDIRLHFQSEQPVVLMDYDPEKILRIVSNLLSNAFKFTPAGGQVLIQTDVKSPEHENKFILKVKDTGVGIPEDKLPDIFNRFYQVDDSSTRKGEGTGIGLALTRELVKIMKGKIMVESRLNEGTVFTVIIPITNNALLSSEPDKQLIANSDHTALAFLNTESLETNSLGYSESELPSLLIVEDNPDVVQYLIACLEDQFQLEIARDGADGIQKAIEQVPDIILSDVMMPKKDGFELCQTLKTDLRTSHIPIVLLTAKADQNARLSGLERGADAYLTKPFNKEELFIQLKNLIEVRRKLQARYRSNKALLPSKDVIYKEEDQFIGNLRTIIGENLEDEHFGIIELCREIAMSRAQLHRKIKALTGRSTSLFIRSVRLQKAKELLQTTSLNISEIAYSIGFSNPNYFTMVFSEEFSCPPSEFRK